MLIYIAIILTIHTLVGLYSVITSRVAQKRHHRIILNELLEQRRHRRIMLNDLKARKKFFDELEKKLMENEVKEG
jgi:hypothetical protein